MPQNPFGVIYATDASGALVPVEVDSSGNLKVAIASDTASLLINQTQPGVTNGVAFGTSSVSAVGLSPVVNATTADAAGLVGKSVGGNMYDGGMINRGTVGGYLMLLDAASIPATGTLAAGTIIDWRDVGSSTVAGGVANLGPYNPPIHFSNGATLIFSTTAPPVATTVAGAGQFKTRLK